MFRLRIGLRPFSCCPNDWRTYRQSDLPIQRVQALSVIDPRLPTTTSHLRPSIQVVALIRHLLVLGRKSACHPPPRPAQSSHRHSSFAATTSINSAVRIAPGLFSFLLSSGSSLSRCKSVSTVGGVILTTRTLDPACRSYVRRFIDQCSHALVPLQTGLMGEKGMKPTMLPTLMIACIS